MKEKALKKIYMKHPIYTIQHKTSNREWQLSPGEAMLYITNTLAGGRLTDYYFIIDKEGNPMKSIDLLVVILKYKHLANRKNKESKKC